ncbi:hypothetical protein [Ascidiimonas aurantiaca]|uniref:hypothetical protein n=1 Tax=Ascidiimonas aurantiaca TaxID=1685432 RepID=UPI0030EB43EE
MILVIGFLVPRSYLGITIWPFIIIRNRYLKNDQTLIRHERIHLKQQLELLVVFFYLWYGLEYFFKRIRYKNHKNAYMNICFEREAYAHESDTVYLKNRLPWQFIKYVTAP